MAETTSTKTVKSRTTFHDAIWLNMVNGLLDSDCTFDVGARGNDCLVPAPWSTDDKSDGFRVPYGDDDVPFLKKSLFSSNATVICKSLHGLVECAYDRRKAVTMLRLDVVSPLNRLTRHQEPFVRQRCCVLIRVLAGQPLGKVSVVRNRVLIGRLLDLLDDTDYRVRFHCAVAFMAMAEHRPGNEAMVELGCADRALDRVYVERDRRVAPVLLRTIGRLMATNRTAKERMNGAMDFGRLFGGTALQRSAAASAFMDGGVPTTAGRMLLDHLKRGARSPDYRTALDSVVCMCRVAVVREANAYLARDRETVALLVSFVSSPQLRGRALRAFSAQLLHAFAGSTGHGFDHVSAALRDTADDRAEISRTANDHPVSERYLQRLADIELQSQSDA